MAVNVGPDDWYCLKVNLEPTSSSPGGVGRPWEEAAEGFPEPVDGPEECRREAVDFLGRAGFPVTYIPAGWRTGSSTGASIETVIKTVGWAYKLIRYVQKLWARHLRKTRRHMLAEYQITVSVNRTWNAVMPALAVLPELITHLEKKFPQVRIRVCLDGAQAADFPCIVDFGSETLKEKHVLAVAKHLKTQSGNVPQLVGYRKRPGIITWDQRKVLADEIALWEFTHPDQRKNFPPGYDPRELKPIEQSEQR